jgi:hypothetical protein
LRCLSKSFLKEELKSQWNADDDLVQARSQQITHFVNKTFPVCESISAAPLKSLICPHKCVEGDVKVSWFYSPLEMSKVKGTKNNHQQFSIIMKFSVESVDQYANQFKNNDFAAMGSFSESDDEEFGTNNNDNMDEL